MSAYLVSDAHINALVTWAAMFKGHRVGYYWRGRHRYIADEPARIASVLYAENVRSVNARYQEHDPAHGFTYRRELQRIYGMQPVQIIKLCHCLAYQSCETADWPDTEAHAILRGIEDAAVRKLPGYEGAAWVLN